MMHNSHKIWSLVLCEYVLVHQMKKYLTVCFWVLEAKMEHLILQYFLTLVMLEMRILL